MNQNTYTQQLKIGIVGSGTAGLVSALLLRKAFPLSEITVVASSDIGIIGVGEGSTEHWSEFMRHCDIELEEMIISSDATHKYGIRFEGWTEKTPRYFHSVGNVDEIFGWGIHATYASFLENEKLFTNQTTSVGLIRNQIRVAGLHRSTNQFHFDTFKLNEYFTHLCFKRSVKFVEGTVSEVNQDNETGNISSVKTVEGDTVNADFWFDATGFKRVLMNSIGSTKWNSFSKYLLCDSAIAFPTESDPSGEIRPYTRAIAASSGWMWEIPTQSRRGNGYVYSSKFISDEDALKEAEEISGYKIEKHRAFKFDAGYLDETWKNNCAAVGLASAFVEPLEATSIGSTIQQVKMLIPYMASYDSSYSKSQKHFNKSFAEVMRNILTMMRLHYYSDRRDTPFWSAMAEMPINDELQELLDLWSERPPARNDVPHLHMELFLTPHMAHVAQGQNVFPTEPSTRALDRLNIRRDAENAAAQMKEERHDHELIDHATALRQLSSIDDEWDK
jgi:tryptophan halogenase